MSQMSQICHKHVTNWWNHKKSIYWFIKCSKIVIFNVSEVPDDVFGLRDTVSQTLWHVCDSLWQICDKCVTKINIGGSVPWIWCFKNVFDELVRFQYYISQCFGTERWCHKHCDMFVTDLRPGILVLKIRLHQGYVWSFWSIGRYLISVWNCWSKYNIVAQKSQKGGLQDSSDVYPN